MPETKQRYEPLSKYYSVPTYATREQFEQETGEPCPAWNPKRRPMSWRLKNAPPSGEEGLDGRPTAKFKGLDPASMGGTSPRLKVFHVALEDCETVNIPPKGEGMTNVPGTDQPEIPVPVEINTATQVLVRRTPFAGPEVMNLDVPEEAAPGSPFERALLDLCQKTYALQLKAVELLGKIAAKLNIA